MYFQELTYDSTLAALSDDLTFDNMSRSREVCWELKKKRTRLDNEIHRTQREIAQIIKMKNNTTNRVLLRNLEERLYMLLNRVKDSVAVKQEVQAQINKCLYGPQLSGVSGMAGLGANPLLDQLLKFSQTATQTAGSTNQLITDINSPQTQQKLQQLEDKVELGAGIMITMQAISTLAAIILAVVAIKNYQLCLKKK